MSGITLTLSMAVISSIIIAVTALIAFFIILFMKTYAFLELKAAFTKQPILCVEEKYRRRFVIGKATVENIISTPKNGFYIFGMHSLKLTDKGFGFGMAVPDCAKIVPPEVAIATEKAAKKGIPIKRAFMENSTTKEVFEVPSIESQTTEKDGVRTFEYNGMLVNFDKVDDFLGEGLSATGIEVLSQRQILNAKLMERHGFDLNSLKWIILGAIFLILVYLIIVKFGGNTAVNPIAGIGNMILGNATSNASVMTM